MKVIFTLIFITIFSFYAVAKKKLCVIAIHGYGQYQDLYKGKLNACTKNGARVIYMGLKGFGPTDLLTKASAADWIRQVKKQVALARQSCVKVTLLGNSTGGALALNHAINESQVPYNIDGLFLLNPALNSPASRATCEVAKTATSILGKWSNFGFVLAELVTGYLREKKKSGLRGAVVGRSRLACSVDDISKHMMQNYLTEARPSCPQCTLTSTNRNTQIISAQMTHFPKIGLELSKKMPFSLIYSRGDKIVSGSITGKLIANPKNTIDSLHISGPDVHNQILQSTKQKNKLRNFCCRKEFNLNCKKFVDNNPVKNSGTVLSSLKKIISSGKKTQNNLTNSAPNNNFDNLSNYKNIKSKNNKAPTQKGKVTAKQLETINAKLNSINVKVGLSATNKITDISANNFNKNNTDNKDLFNLREKIIRGKKNINPVLFTKLQPYQSAKAIKDYTRIKNVSKNSTKFCTLAYCPSSYTKYFEENKKMFSLSQSDPKFFNTIKDNHKVRAKYQNQRSQTLKALNPFVKDIQKIQIKTPTNYLISK